MNWADYLGLGIIAVAVIVPIWWAVDGFVQLYKLRNVKLDRNDKKCK